MSVLPQGHQIDMEHSHLVLLEDGADNGTSLVVVHTSNNIQTWQTKTSSSSPTIQLHSLQIWSLLVCGSQQKIYDLVFWLPAPLFWPSNYSMIVLSSLPLQTQYPLLDVVFSHSP